MLSGLLQLELNIVKQYRFYIFISIFHVLVLLSLFYFLSNTIGPRSIFKGEYFPFIVLGLVVSQFYQTASTGSVGTLMDWQHKGLLETIFISPKPRSLVLLTAGLPDIFKALAKGFGLIAISLLIFGAKWEAINVLGLLATLALTFLFCQGLNLIGLASVLMWKRINIITFSTSLATTILSGVYFPIKVLPEIVQKLSAVIPFTHSVSLFRWSFGSATNGFQPLTSLAVLVTWSFVLLGIGYFFFNFVEKRLMEKGALVTY